MSGTGRRPSAVRSYLVAARIGVGIAFVAPILWFVARYWWAYRTTDGIPTVLAQGMIAGIAVNRLGFDAASFLEEDAHHVQALPRRAA